MILYAFRRLLQAIPLVLGASLLTFTLMHLAPGDPIVALAGEDGNPEIYAMMRARFGLDRPLPERLLIYLKNLLQGELGFSYRFNQPALDVILEQLPNTLLLMIPALVLAIIVGIGLGLWSAQKAGTATDFGIVAFSLTGNTVPVFWLAQILLLVLAFQFDLFPVQGMVDVRARHTGWRYGVDVAHHMALPVFVLMVQYVAPIARISRASLLEVINQPYMQTALSKGLSRRRILFFHALPNALLPIVTVIGGQVGFMFAGAILTETVFAWPGLGRLLLGAMLNRDYAIVTAMFLILSLTVILANLVTDISYFWLDPRLREQ